jgi:5-methylcytosine-specific restriction endonuclease McrA
LARLRPCPRCLRLRPDGQACPRCPRDQRSDEARQRRATSTRAKVYASAAWRRLRRARLQLDAYECQECGEPATTVDHLDGVTLDALPALDRLESLCPRCHGKREARRQQTGKR